MDAMTAAPVDPTRDDLPSLLHHLVARQAATTPEAIAVVDGPRTLSYGELDRRANQLAHLLAGRGVGPESLVGVCLERGFDLVTALLGVWRAGGAYVPLDPSHPAERRDWILTDTAARVLLTSGGIEGGTGAAEVIRLDRPGLLDGLPDTDPRAAVAPDAPAYAIYTSGSTGRPKGVVITHAGIANRVAWTITRHGLGPADRVLQKTSISFDAAGWEFFGPLSSGGTVVLAPIGAERDPAQMVAAVAEHGVTVLQGVPSVLRLVADEPGWAACDSLRLVFSAGEPLHGELAARLRGGRDRAVWNTYGPTECSIDVSAYEVDPALTAGPVPIGRPIEGMRLLVLDDEGFPVPVGMAGELHVGGVGVGRGYLGRPDATAERFVPDPYGPAGQRLYRTGDQVRWRADGVLEYLGRGDDQVKINGVRIEPAEIEAALAGHTGVRSATVTAYTDASGTKRLAAYVVKRTELDSSGLREWLSARLPDALVPTTLRFLETLPLTPSGKVDRKALPPIDEPTRREYVAPRTASEQAVAQAWQDLLGVPTVGLHDDFFELGGSSLVLTRLANRLNTHADGRIALRRLFRAVTVESQARLLDESAGEQVRALVPADRAAALPLSFGQHRLWFLDQMHPGSPEWVSPLFLRLPAIYSPQLVRQALRQLEQRHEALRTRYATVGGQPTQVIAEAGDVELRIADATETELPQLFAEQFQRGFDLAQGPLWRAMLVRVPGADHVLLATVHHIASDGWTTVVLERDLRELCAALAQDRPAALPALPVQYADYAAWQRAEFTDAALAADLAFWRQNLDGLTPLDLPLDRPRPAERDSRGSGVRVNLPAPLAAAVTELGRAAGATPFMTLLAGFAAVLARQAGQWDLPVGTPVAGRLRPEVEHVAGFFLNSLVLRCDLRPDMGFTEAVARAREVCTTAFAHQSVPFERVVDELVPVRDLSRTPLYQVAFDLQDEGGTSVVARDAVAMEAFQRAWGVAKTDLTLFMWRREDGSLDAAFEYATSLFDEATVQALADRFVRLLELAAADPAAPLGGLDLLTEGERERLLVSYNDSFAPRTGASVLDLFEAQAATHPDRVAVATETGTVCYAELDARANQIAHQLRALGVDRGSVVAVLLERGTRLPAAMLGVWKAGAAYLPVDPSYPAERVAQMLATAGATMVVTQASYADRFEVPSLLVDTHALMIAASPAQRPGRATDPEELAYVIFTSGSTGTPKGVMVTHRGLANHVVWAAEELASQGEHGAPLFSSYAFDLVVPNLWGPLVTGQAVRMLPPDADATQLGKLLAEAGPYSFIKLTPGHLELLGHQLDDAQAAALAPIIVVAGEALPGTLATRWQHLLGPGRLVNEYGPTEASVGTCIYPVHAAQDVEVVPIGYPLPNMAMHVLDAGMRLLPPGVVGELYVGGTGVARGYAHRPDLTAERFLPDPYGPAGSRLYRTGDLARRLADGAVEFLGRIDDQVKIRGYRIELGEIRAVLETHPGVRTCAVVVAQRPNGEKQLAAYVVGDTADLAAHCAVHLPEYMIPSVFVALDELPLNANGKVDRGALPDPFTAFAAEQFEAPSTLAQERIAAIWSELLGTPAVGVRQNFFALGGHSILAVRLVSRLQEEFDLDLSIRLIFERPTVAGLAEAIEDRIWAEESALLTSSTSAKEHQA
ncbi:hypothetical protein Cs7R123_61930 [Catellatospora sp. TT07R-123]|uniref:non-ribosomal peptide synthetase n=1 Tax=Catellatospora sp. TT07R-123 TaxID=2733863 RepID=UPI001B08E437|nr:non-ribosomal peptide synthetase [Catellatospora sp. TT07R-123]GHJ48851.1 hypothetical protein Cs7R123_61930 [Catellatospora sp. TT07R-123]